MTPDSTAVIFLHKYFIPKTEIQACHFDYQFICKIIFQKNFVKKFHLQNRKIWFLLRWSFGFSWEVFGGNFTNEKLCRCWDSQPQPSNLQSAGSRVWFPKRAVAFRLQSRDNEEWRILGPILSLLSPIFVNCGRITLIVIMCIVAACCDWISKVLSPSEI